MTTRIDAGRTTGTGTMLRSLTIKLTLGSALAAGMLAVAAPAHAACCVAYDYTDAANNKNQVISQLTDRINAMQLAIIEAMRLGTGQLSGNLKETIGANSNTANVQDDRQVTGRVETARLTAIASSSSGASSCNVITGANAAANVNAQVKGAMLGDTHDFAKWDAGVSPMPSANGPGAAVEARHAQHCSKYSSTTDVTSGLCQTGGGGGALELADQDIGKSILYSPDNSTSETLDQDHLNAAHEFALNAIDPMPPGPMLAAQAKEPGARLLEARRHSASARMSVAAAVMSDAISFREPLVGDQATSWIKAMNSQTNNPGNPASGNASKHDYMQARALGWYFNSNWGVAADTQNEAQAIKDIAMMGSFAIVLQWEQFKQAEKTNLLLATVVSILNQQHREAADSGR